MKKMKKNKKMEIFKNNLKCHGFSTEFIQSVLNYFNELEEEEVDYIIKNLIKNL